MYINFFISLSELTSSFYIHNQGVGGAKNRQWHGQLLFAAAVFSELYKLSASCCNSLFAVLLWSCSAYWWSPSHTSGVAASKCNSV